MLLTSSPYHGYYTYINKTLLKDVSQLFGVDVSVGLQRLLRIPWTEHEIIDKSFIDNCNKNDIYIHIRKRLLEFLGNVIGK